MNDGLGHCCIQFRKLLGSVLGLVETVVVL